MHLRRFRSGRRNSHCLKRVGTPKRLRQVLQSLRQRRQPLNNRLRKLIQKDSLVGKEFSSTILERVWAQERFLKIWKEGKNCTMNLRRWAQQSKWPKKHWNPLQKCLLIPRRRFARPSRGFLSLKNGFSWKMWSQRKS